MVGKGNFTLLSARILEAKCKPFSSLVCQTSMVIIRLTDSIIISDSILAIKIAMKNYQLLLIPSCF